MVNCILETIEGPKEAVVSAEAHRDWAGRNVQRVSAVDGSFAIDVPEGLAQRKLSESGKPNRRLFT